MTHEPVGSVAEEAIKLMRALAGDSSPDHAQTCTWCPFCQLVNAVRDNPDMIESALVAATSFLATAKDFIDATVSSRAGQAHA
ncbi:hypothetical protein BH09ACT10_BH09ACT10_03100 [soil metagenome]